MHSHATSSAQPVRAQRVLSSCRARLLAQLVERQHAVVIQIETVEGFRSRPLFARQTAIAILDRLFEPLLRRFPLMAAMTDTGAACAGVACGVCAGASCGVCAKVEAPTNIAATAKAPIVAVVLMGRSGSKCRECSL